MSTARRFSTPIQAALNIANRLHGYVPALAGLVIALALHFAIIRLHAPNSPAILLGYLFALLLGAWCGYGPGVAVVLGCAVAGPLLLDPKFHIGKVSIGGVAVLSFASLVVSRIAKDRRQTEEKLRARNADLDDLVREQTVQLREANKALRHQVAQLEHLYAKTPAGLGLLNTELRFIRASEALAALDGVTVDRHFNRTWDEVMRAPGLQDMRPLLEQVLATRQPLHDYELKIEGRGPDGPRFWILDCSPVSKDDTLIGVQIVVRDVTDRKFVEQSMRQLNRELQQANSDLAQFTFAASHNLVEPLRMVSLYSQMLKKRFGGQLGSEGDEYIGYAIEGALRMERLLKDLLAYTLASSPKHDAPSVVESGAALRTATAQLNGVVTTSNAEVVSDALPQIPMHEDLLVQLFQNLIENGIKFNRSSKPRVTVSAELVPDGWRFAVTDNGIGVPKEYSKQIFELFKRLHTGREYPGTGVGLAICRRIVERHGGQIWVESGAGGGSTFFFTVPRQAWN